MCGTDRDAYVGGDEDGERRTDLDAETAEIKAKFFLSDLS